MKFYGRVGYGTPDETQNGVWTDAIDEREYYGDVVKDTRRLGATQEGGESVTLGNSIEILADPYALEHFYAIKYVEWAGALWTVTEIEQKRPRLILRLGGVYNGPRPTSDATTESGSTGATPAPIGRDSGR
jgi:hypothetical protein